MSAPVTRTPRARAVPPLESGDRLTRAEFERRYEARDDDRKCELIDGVVYVASPARHTHGESQGLALLWLGSYALETPGANAVAAPSLRLDDENVPEPDAVLRLRPEVGGRCTVDGEDFLRGPPELVVEVAVTSASLDLHQKRALYARAGVREYVVVLAWEEEVRWFEHDGHDLVACAPDPDGLLRSRAFPGLWLDPAGLARLDGPAVAAALRRGLRAPEHAAFVAELVRRAGP